MTITDHRRPLLESPDGESRAQILRVGDAFPLDPSTDIFEYGTETGSGPSTRPWGLRYAATPQPRTEVTDAVERWVYDPHQQMTVDRLTHAPRLGRHTGGTKETTGTTDNQKPSSEETGSD
ncbi:putative ATP-grasp-modified RiPP [Nocardiopsis sp. EMB25]|uniref:putative ATP-grasp-modified RiPP n=1 Tax=Nocardiopsis sp. EMB25 TaxID=2835867 RepID=UPI002283C631|nr:putative ATP-grasp-modified RiPP [Nocardiopsis sp. EMB25]MCY9787053.1 putative ATP-grasp-modified RiPP [Nocardiopsis sp. EMB25]